MCVPLWNNREVIGLIYVDNRHRAGLFSEENLRMLTHLANVAAIKIENAQLTGATFGTPLCFRTFDSSYNAVACP